MSKLFGNPDAPFSPSSPRAFVSLDARWSLAIAALWLVASLYRTIDLSLHTIRLHQLWKTAVPVDIAPRVEPLLRRTAARLCTTDQLERPSVIGFFSPRILIPDWLYSKLSVEELEQIVLHESEHLRRHDDWTNLLQKVSLVLFPLNPVLLWIERHLCFEREVACDDGVIRITRAPRTYATCLANLAERSLDRRTEALSLGAWQRRPELVRRVHKILSRRKPLGPIGSRIMASAIGCSLVVGTAELARCPQLISFVSSSTSETAASDKPVALAPGKAQVVNAVTKMSAIIPTSPSSNEPVATRAVFTKVQAAMPLNSSGYSAVPVSYDDTPKKTTARHNAQSLHSNASDKFSPRIQLLKAANAQAPQNQESLFTRDPVKDDPLLQQSGLIVLTTWEQRAIPMQSAAIDSGAGTDMSDEQTDDSVIQTSEQRRNQATYQTTITRTLMKVVPTSSGEYKLVPIYAAGPLRTGWLVIQL